MQLVDEEHRGVLGPAPRRRENFAQFGHVGHDGVDAHEAALRLAGDHLGQARLAAAGRPVEQQAAKAVAGDEPGQQIAFLQDVLLPDDLPEPLRAHPGRERLMGGGLDRERTARARSFLAKE